MAVALYISRPPFSIFLLFEPINRDTLNRDSSVYTIEGLYCYEKIKIKNIIKEKTKQTKIIEYDVSKSNHFLNIILLFLFCMGY